MKNTSDPSTHRAREQQLVSHVINLLEDPRLRLDTINGNRAIATLKTSGPNRFDRATDLQRMMSEVGIPDRQLRDRMPIGEQLDVTLWQRKMVFFKRVVGRLRVMCVSPTKSLLTGETPKPMTTQEITRCLTELPPSLGGVPTTVVLLSTSGFTLEAHEAAERRPDRTLILVEPNDAGGWSVYGPPESKSLVDLFDPEADEQKRQRVLALLDEMKVDLLSGGIATDKLAAKSQLPLQFIEEQLKSYAKQNPGLVAKRLDGRVVLFREGSASVASSGAKEMAFVDRIKSLFARKGETEKKIALLSEQKAGFAQQLDRAYDEIGTLEKRDAELRDEFKNASGAVTKRRITSQLVQLRKDIERRQQLIGVLNQRVNVVSTHLHNLELVRSDESAKMPDSEEIANDAAAAEEMLAELQANNEVAESVGGIAHAGLSEEEQALYEELEREAKGGVSMPDHADEKVVDEPMPTTRVAEKPVPQRESSVPPTPASQDKRRSEPEPG
jgi:hypothetical protein